MTTCSRTRHGRGLRLAGALVALAMLGAACGGDDDDDAAPDTAGAATTVADGGPTETTATEPPDAPETTTGDTTAGTAAEPDETMPATSVAGSAPADDCEATVAGSEINFGVYSPAPALDPLQSTASIAGGSDLIAIYDTLTRWDAASGAWVPHIVESWESNDELTEWTFTLREGVSYANGDPLLAQHVLDNMTRMLQPGRNSARSQIALIDLENSDAPDDRTFVLRTFEPLGSVPSILGSGAGMIVNPALGSEVDDQETSVISNEPNGAGAGPYLVERWAPGESPYLVLKARDDYWGGPVCVETINFVTLPDDRTKLESLELGELNVAVFRTANINTEVHALGYDEISNLVSSGEILMINNGIGNHTPVTADVRFRRAVALALDPEIISTQAFDGALLGSKGLIAESSALYGGVEGPAANLDEAKALVEELKAEGWDGTVRLLARNLVPNQPVVVQSLLEAAGMTIDMTIGTIDAIAGAVIVEQDFDMAMWGLTITDSTPDASVSANFLSTSPGNRVGYNSPEMDAAIVALNAASNIDEQREAMTTIAEIYAEDLPLVTYGAVEELYAMAPGVKGVVGTGQSMIMFHDAYIES